MARPATRAARAAEEEEQAPDAAAAAATTTSGPDAVASTLPLTKEMRRATRTAHHAANALILAKLAFALNGGRATYARALASFHPVYEELERQLRLHASHPVLGGVATAALPLARTRAMEEDLAFLLGGGGGGGGAVDEVQERQQKGQQAAHGG